MFWLTCTTCSPPSPPPIPSVRVMTAIRLGLDSRAREYDMRTINCSQSNKCSVAVADGMPPPLKCFSSRRMNLSFCPGRRSCHFPLLLSMHIQHAFLTSHSEAIKSSTNSLLLCPGQREGRLQVVSRRGRRGLSAGGGANHGGGPAENVVSDNEQQRVCCGLEEQHDRHPDGRRARRQRHRTRGVRRGGGGGGRPRRRRPSGARFGL